MELETVEDMVTTLDAAAADEVDEVGEGASASLDFIAVESFSRFQLDITGFFQVDYEDDSNGGSSKATVNINCNIKEKKIYHYFSPSVYIKSSSLLFDKIRINGIEFRSL